MNESIDLEEAREIFNIDVGGTPANVLEKGKVSFLINRGIKPKQLVVVVDPFDLSRVERSLVLSKTGNIKRFKFSVETYRSEKVSSAYAKPPLREKVLQLFNDNRGRVLDALYTRYQIFKREKKEEVAKRYDTLQEKVVKLTESSKNLREFMNSLILTLSPGPIKLIYLETLLSENQNKVYDVLQKRNIESRVFCLDCGKMVPYVFSNDKLAEIVCCSSTADDVIKRGSYVPEEGMLPALIYLSGINPCVRKDSNYGAKALGILRELGKLDRPLIMYSGKPDKNMFEDFMLGG